MAEPFLRLSPLIKDYGMKITKDINVHLENKKESRLFFAFIILMYTVVYMTKNCFSGALSSIVAEGSLTLTQATIISAAFFFAYGPLQILGGIFADKYSPEKLIIISLIGSAVANTVIFFNQNFYVMLFSWIFNAVIQFALWPSVFKIISSQLVRSDRGNMIFIMSFSSSFGLVLSFLISSLIPSSQWRYNFAISVVALSVLALIMGIFCRHLSPLIIKDRKPQKEETETNENKMSTTKLFMMSGFFAFLPSVFIRFMMESGTKNLSSTMLMQSYKGISPSVGNLLSVIIILAGTLGVFAVKFVLYPRFIKNEMTGCLITTLLSVPFAILVCFVGRIPAWIVVMGLAAINLLIGATTILTNYYNTNFTKYEKNGTAAGIINAFASFGAAFQFCVFGRVADKLGWEKVTAAWAVMVAVSVVFILIALKPANKFKKL